DPASSRSSRTLYGGLFYRGRFAGVIPDLWRPKAGMNDAPMERKSPVAGAPTDDGVVMFEHVVTGDALYSIPQGKGGLEWAPGGNTPRSPFTSMDNFSTGFPGWDPGVWWSTGMTFVLEHLGTNVSGHDEWFVLDALDDSFGLFLFPNGNVGLSSSPDAWLIEPSPNPGHVRLRHAADGRCLTLGSLPNTPTVLGSCNPIPSDLVMTTVVRGTSIPGNAGGDPGGSPVDPVDPGVPSG
ncbi:MAG: hypothetical protein AAGA56_26765, partial [Myxococcota bacterium]